MLFLNYQSLRRTTIRLPIFGFRLVNFSGMEYMYSVTNLRLSLSDSGEEFMYLLTHADKWLTHQ